MAPNRRSGPSSSNNSENPDVATVITQQLQAIITQVANNTNNANNGNNGGGNGNDGNTDVLLRHSNLAIPRSTMGKVRYITGLAPEIRGMLRATQPTTILTAILRAGILTDEAVSCGTLTKGSDKRKGVEEPSKTGGFCKDNKKEKTGTGFMVTAPTRNETLSQHKAVIVCHDKVVEIRVEDGRILRVHGERAVGITKALKSAKEDEPKLNDIPVVREFEDVFPEDLSGLPPQ
ncbi:hypothetical protein Tco_1458849 [Tanacetum coccineum]